jgi:predicted metal-dependent phosphoesterase TrpH
MSVKIDLHCHSFFSGDGVSSPEQLIEAARRKELNAFVITDHNTCDAITYLLDKDLMREDGLPVNDFLVVPGVEVTTAEGHLLCIGAILPNLKGRPALEVCHLIHEAGGLAREYSEHSTNRRHRGFQRGEHAQTLQSVCF